MEFQFVGSPAKSKVPNAHSFKQTEPLSGLIFNWHVGNQFWKLGIGIEVPSRGRHLKAANYSASDPDEWSSDDALYSILNLFVIYALKDGRKFPVENKKFS